jgi:hypothetical protein
MATTLLSQPLTVHSSGNDNWFVFQSDLRFAPRFNMKMSILNESNVLYNTVLVPTNPSNLNVFNIKNIIDDYVTPDFNCFITSATASQTVRQYKLGVTENFEGLYITASSSGGRVATASVINNYTLKSIVTPALVSEIGFVGGSITSPTVYVYSYATASNGYINRLSLSSSATSNIPATGSIGTSEGFIVLTNYTVFSDTATYSTSLKFAAGANFDYLDYNSTNNYSGFVATSATASFLTKAPSGISIQPNEAATLSFIQGLTQAVTSMYVVDNLGATYSKSITIATASVKIDIPSGTQNLNIAGSADWYEITLRNGTQSVSQTFRYNINCLNIYWTPFRVCWLNSYGGIDYYTFKFINNSSKRVERSNFDKQIVYGSTNQDRGLSTYRLNDFDQFTVVSDPLNDDESNWLQELFISNEVYWIRNGALIPITLTNDTYERNVGLESRELSCAFRLSRTNRK